MAQPELPIYPLNGVVQHYAWGGYDFIPQLLGVNNEERKPFAEYWMGAHPNHSSAIEVKGNWISLHDYIQQNPTAVLGTDTATTFHSLPYLLKILDVRQMLSIQVHPDKASAQINFKKENEASIPVTAPDRNYKDDNHKPELMIALSDFWLLHGFKPATQLIEVLSTIPDFEFLIPVFEKGGYKALYEKVMTMEQEEVNTLLRPIAQRILPLYENGELKKEQEDFWAARAVKTFCKDNNFDRGIFSIYFFNLVHLKNGEGVYQPAQLPHAYLEGQNVELMANSDNVLRAGLTDKHVDVAELMKYVRFEETVPLVLGTTAYQKETEFLTPAPEFKITHYQLKAGEEVRYETFSAEIVFVLSGALKIIVKEKEVMLRKGQAAFIMADNKVQYTSESEVDFFRAAVPNVKK